MRAATGAAASGRAAGWITATHADGDHDDDAEGDQDIADAEDVREWQPGRQGEDVRERSKGRILEDITPSLATMAARLEIAPSATRANPGTRRLRQTAMSTSPVEAT